MKTISFLLISLFFLTFEAKAQFDSLVLNTIYSEIRKAQPFGVINYGEKLPTQAIRNIIKSISKRKIISESAKPTKDSIWLTSIEIKYLQQQLEKLYHFIWRDEIFPNSKRHPTDSLESVVHHLNKTLLDSSKLLKDSASIGKFYSSHRQFSLFNFSKPIFIRKNTIFLLFFLWFNGTNSGSDGLFFYKKKDKVWKKWIVVQQGFF
jgi:hypothetical protein